MTSGVSRHDVERFRATVALRLGLWFDDGKLEQLAGVLGRRLRAVDDEAPRYLSGLEAQGKPAELREIAQELTVGETYFFRHNDQFRAFSEIALPARIQARASTRQLRLLSAGCSSGEEAYSLSILARACTIDTGIDVAVSAVDLNTRSLERAREARYSVWALRETPGDLRARYFEIDGRDYVLSRAIRDSVEFQEGNLVAGDTWANESFDVIFCRNVLMYFTPEHAQRVVARFFRALAPGGYLFLGHAENLRGVSQDFELCHTHGTFYYQRKNARGAPLTPPAAFRASPRGEAPSQPKQALDWASTWLETVQRSSDRIRELTEKPALESAPAASARVSTARARVSAARARVSASARLEFGPVLELLSQERFAEALRALTLLPSDGAANPDALLLRAALLTHCDRLQDAEQACVELLAIDGLNAGAHYLRSLCQERQGDTRAAVDHAQIASYLDPAFAMPHLHLGLMARRTGDRSTAQRELTQASQLLLREEPARLLLFGGGFSREGLVALCRSELDRLGGSS